MISFVRAGAPASPAPSARNVDAEQTKLVAAPLPAGGAGETTPSPVGAPAAVAGGDGGQAGAAVGPAQRARRRLPPRA